MTNKPNQGLITDNLDWPHIEKVALDLFKQYMNEEISEVDYISKTESLFRNYIANEPEHPLCKQNLAYILDKKLAKSAQVDRQAILRELVLLSPLKRYKEELARSVYAQHRGINSTQEVIKIIAHAIYPGLAESMDESNPDFENVLQLLTHIDPSASFYRRELAKVLFSKINKEETNARIKELYESCIELDPETPLYREQWLERLHQEVEELTAEDVMQKLSLYFEILHYEPANTDIKKQLENLLLDQEAAIHQKEEDGLLRKQTYISELSEVYRNLMKLEPENAAYKYSLAKLSMQNGKDMKGNQNIQAYRLFQQVVALEPENDDALLRMAIIHIYESEYPQAYQLLKNLSKNKERFAGTNLEIEFYIAYASASANLGKLEEADEAILAASELDGDGQFRFDIAHAKTQINMSRKIKFYQVSKIGHESTIMDSISIDQMLQAFEEKRNNRALSNIFFDFRDMDSPKIIGPARTKIIGGEGRVRILQYLLESKAPKSIEDIRQACLLEKVSKVTMNNIRKDLDFVFGKAPGYVKDHVVVTKDGSTYQWDFKGETCLITLEQ